VLFIVLFYMFKQEPERRLFSVYVGVKQVLHACIYVNKHCSVTKCIVFTLYGCAHHTVVTDAATF